MGNCQAADAAAVVIQYPGGKVERLHWPTTAANVMKSNPGYHVALVTLDVPPNERHDGGVGIRITRVKLLKPKEMLLLGQVYRLIASQEVAKALRRRQYEKLLAEYLFCSWQDSSELALRQRTSSIKDHKARMGSG